MRAGGGNVRVAGNPAAATWAAVAAAIVVHGIRQSVRWAKGRWAAVQSGGTGGGVAALCRVFYIGILLLLGVVAGSGVVGKGCRAAVQSGGAGGGLAALCRVLGIAFSLAYCSIGVGIGWVVGYRFRQSLRLDVSPHGRGVLRIV